MHKNLTREQIIETVGVIALAALAAGLVWKSRPLLFAALLLLATGLFVKPAARWIAVAWMKFAAVLAAFNTRILLGAIFFGFLTPLALLARVFRSDFLHLRRKAGEGRTYWQTREQTYTAGDLEKPW